MEMNHFEDFFRLKVCQWMLRRGPNNIVNMITSGTLRKTTWTEYLYRSPFFSKLEIFGLFYKSSLVSDQRTPFVHDIMSVYHCLFMVYYLNITCIPFYKAGGSSNFFSPFDRLK